MVTTQSLAPSPHLLPSIRGLPPTEEAEKPCTCFPAYVASKIWAYYPILVTRDLRKDLLVAREGSREDFLHSQEA